jgi:hypothetical protein
LPASWSDAEIFSAIRRILSAGRRPGMQHLRRSLRDVDGTDLVREVEYKNIPCRKDSAGY